MGNGAGNGAGNGGRGGGGGGETLSFFNVPYDSHPIYFHLPLYKYPRLIISNVTIFFLTNSLILSSWLLTLILFDDVDIDFSGALAREAPSGAPWVRECGKLAIQDNLVIT